MILRFARLFGKHAAALIVALALAGVATPPVLRADDQTFRVGGSEITVSLAPDLGPRPADVLFWVHQAADAVAAYYGRYPVPTLQLAIRSRRGEPVNSGTAYEGQRIVIHLDPSATPAELAKDWMLTHEMFHLGFPSLPRRYHYLEEGLSDYLEPLARARLGQLTEQQVWNDFVEGMPQGLPKPGDGGLDGTRAWGRTYWGGCIFWLLVDLEIRERTRNTHSLDDAIRAIVVAGGTGDATWPLEKMIRIGDAATGTDAIARIHALLGPKPFDPELDEVWRRLGVRKSGRNVMFDDNAPLASLRRAMTTRIRQP